MTVTVHRYVQAGEVRVFYRESMPGPDAPVLLLLHGFPSGSHQFRSLIDALGTRYRLIAPDYPGFGHTQTPGGFAYSFDSLAEITEIFITWLGLTRFVMYAFDYGAPGGFRLAERHPGWIAGLVIESRDRWPFSWVRQIRPEMPGWTGPAWCHAVWASQPLRGLASVAARPARHGRTASGRSHRRGPRGDTQRNACAGDEGQQQDPGHVHR